MVVFYSVFLLLKSNIKKGFAFFFSLSLLECSNICDIYLAPINQQIVRLSSHLGFLAKKDFSCMPIARARICKFVLVRVINMLKSGRSRDTHTTPLKAVDAAAAAAAMSSKKQSKARKQLIGFYLLFLNLSLFLSLNSRKAKEEGFLGEV